MSPRKPEQYEALRQKSRKKILEAAFELFATKGYLPSSMKTIALKAGVSKGLVYNYFESKEALLKSILQEEIKALFDQMPTPEPGQALLPVLMDIIHASFLMFRNDSHHTGLLVALLAQPHIHGQFGAFYKDSIRKKMPEFIRLFADLGEAKPKAAAYALGATLDGIALDWHLMGEDFPLDEVEQYLTDDLIRKYGHHE